MGAQIARDSAVGPPPAPLCLRGRPLPRCDNFVLYELGLDGSVASTKSRASFPSGGGSYTTRDVPGQLSLAVGGMHNRDPRTAVGGVLLFGASVGRDVNTARTFGVVGRWRRWHGANQSVELGAGPALVRIPADPRSTPGALPYISSAAVVGEARANAGDLVAASARLTVVPVAARRPRAGLSVGGSLGSYAGLAGTAAIGALVVYVAYALSGS